MLDALRYLRSSVGDFFFDMPRMVLANLFWFAASLPFIWLTFVVVRAIGEGPPVPWAVFGLWVTPPLLLSLALAGPATAATHALTNRVAHGDLMVPSQFWAAFRRYFWRGWGLATLDAAAGAVLAINVGFYWSFGETGLWLLSIVFAYLLIIWIAIQGYLFALLVELDQSIRLVLRNALFLALDRPGLTLGLMLANLLLLVLSVPLGALVLPFASMVIASTMNNKAIVEAIRSYRESGRLLSSR